MERRRDIHIMFGWTRKKKSATGKGGQDSGLAYAGSPAPGQQPKPAGAGEILRTYETDRGTLEMRDSAMVLSAKEGTITIPYHEVDAWDSSGREFRVWWSGSSGGARSYVVSCVPSREPASDMAAELRDIIHRNTFVE